MGMIDKCYWWKDRTADYKDCETRWFINNNRYLDFEDIRINPRSASKLVSKFESIIYNTITEFSGSGLKIMDETHDTPSLISRILIFENTGESMILIYDISGKSIIGPDSFFLDLGLRDITDITMDEMIKIQKVILVWILNHIAD